MKRKRKRLTRAVPRRLAVLGGFAALLVTAAACSSAAARAGPAP